MGGVTIATPGSKGNCASIQGRFNATVLEMCLVMAGASNAIKAMLALLASTRML
jgi:hypothetical protein